MDMIAFRALPAPARERLLRCRNMAVRSDSGMFLQSQDNPQWLWLGFVVTGAIAFASGAALISYWASEPARTPDDELIAGVVLVLLTIPASAYCIVCLLELVRRGASQLRPFALVSPVEIIEADYDHGMITRHRLDQATDFNIVQEYGSGQRYKGLRYTFVFGKGGFSLLLKDRAGAEALDAVLAKARALRGDEQGKAAARAQLAVLPEMPASGAKSNRPFTRPFSVFWLGVLAVYLLAAVALFVIGQAIRRKDAWLLIIIFIVVIAGTLYSKYREKD